MSDIIIPLASNDFELRYALRSIQKHLKGQGKIYIGGNPRGWLTGVTYIHSDEHKVKANSPGKQRRIFNTLVLAAINPEVSDPLIFWSDDIFLLKPLNVSDIKYYKQGDLMGLSEITSGVYRQAVLNTNKYLKEKGLATINFDLHIPVVYEKTKLLKLLECDWRWNYLIQSLYCNYWKTDGQESEDFQLFSKYSEPEILSAIKDKQFLVINEGAINDDMKKVLEALYPEKSIYEVF